MAQEITEQEFRAREFAKARAAFVTAALAFDRELSVHFEGDGKIEFVVRTQTANYFRAAALKYRNAEAGLTIT